MAMCERPKSKEKKKTKTSEVLLSNLLEHKFREGSAVLHLQDELEIILCEFRSLRKLVVEVPFDAKKIAICKSREELHKAEQQTLRSTEQTLKNCDVKLFQFDPNFFAESNNIQCRSLGCPQQRKRQPGVKKEDLYLCPTHRKILEDFVEKVCKEKYVLVSHSTKSEDFEGYTSLIGTLENAFTSLIEPKRHVRETVKASANVVQEVCLNMRNYLMIVNALLNPDCLNKITACCGIFRILKAILAILRDDVSKDIQRLTELVELLRTVMESILFRFGVIYSWIEVSVNRNPGAKIGAAIGGFCGFLGFGVGPGIGVFTTITGATFGSWMGDGLYQGIFPSAEDHITKYVFNRYQKFFENIHPAQRDSSSKQVEVKRRPDTALYYLTGTPTGDLLLFGLLVVVGTRGPSCSS